MNKASQKEDNIHQDEMKRPVTHTMTGADATSEFEAARQLSKTWSMEQE